MCDNGDMRGTFGLTAEQKTKMPRSETGKARTDRDAKPGDPHVANALRNAYQEAVSEDVPQEFLDLLGKLA
jgi:hypothetical protein